MRVEVRRLAVSALFLAFIAQSYNVFACDPLRRLARHPRIRADFETDLRKILQADISKKGYQLDESDSAETALIKYINLEARQVPVRSWKVVLSSKLSNRMLDKDTQEGLNALLEKAKQGASLNPHLSTRISDLDYNDLLFNDWGIYHFHLGKTVNPKTGFAERTSNLLFAMVQGDTIYCVDVLPHGSFANTTLLKTVHEEFPQTIAPFRLNLDGKKLTFQNFTDDQLTAIRQAGIQVMVPMPDGTVYAPPGGGITAAKANLAHVRKAQMTMLRLYDLERTVAEHESDIRKHISKNNGGHCPGKLQLKLIGFDANSFILLEKQTNVKFRVEI